MHIHSARFVSSGESLTHLPPEKWPEFAFIGRSNVGKSSLINKLTQRRELARTSSKPGKTQLINHFIINEQKTPWYIVDLPGFGYAKVAKTMREKFEEFITEYLTGRKSLMCTLVLIDIRIPPQQIDLEFMDWLGEEGLPFAIVFTKSDKLKRQELSDNLNTYLRKLEAIWAQPPLYFVTSAQTGSGCNELLAFLERTMKGSAKKQG